MNIMNTRNMQMHYTCQNHKTTLDLDILNTNILTWKEEFLLTHIAYQRNFNFFFCDKKMMKGCVPRNLFATNFEAYHYMLGHNYKTRRTRNL